MMKICLLFLILKCGGKAGYITRNKTVGHKTHNFRDYLFPITLPHLILNCFANVILGKMLNHASYVAWLYAFSVV